MCDKVEADYLIGTIAEIFPSIPVTEDQIRYRFTGVRPLPRSDGSIGQVTRDLSIAELALPDGAPVLCLIGGKWTTFRGFSQQATDRVLKILGKDRRCRTEDMQIGGGKGYPAATDRSRWVAGCATQTGIAEDRINDLLTRYGTRATQIAGALGADTPLISLPAYGEEELVWLCRNERVGDLEDLLRRRTDIAISGQMSEPVRAEVSILFARSGTQAT